MSGSVISLLFGQRLNLLPEVLRRGRHTWCGFSNVLFKRGQQLFCFAGLRIVDRCRHNGNNLKNGSARYFKDFTPGINKRAGNFAPAITFFCLPRNFMVGTSELFR